MAKRRAVYQVPLPPPVPEGAVFVRLEGLKTKNPNNGAMGNTKLAAIIKANRRKVERTKAREAVIVGLLQRPFENAPVPPLRVAVTRVAPSQGLDPHDGLGAALKGILDGVADALGFRNDRDPNLQWVLGQRRGGRGEYAVEVLIESIAEAGTWPRGA